MSLQLLSAETPTVARTYGWDTVSAVRVPDMNRAIRDAGSSPREFKQSLNGMSVSARFDDWRVGNGGDGKILHLETPLENVVVDYEGKKYELNRVDTIVSVQLHFLPHTPLKGAKAANGVVPHKLVVRTTVSDPEDTPAIVLDVQPSGQDSADIKVRAIIKLCLQEWLNSNLSSFTHIFATVNLHNMVTDAAFHWLQPTYVSYVFAASRNPQMSIFAILCRTGDRNADALIEQISPSVIPPGATAGFLLSPTRMVTDMIAPSLPNVYKALKPKDLNIDEDTLEIAYAGSVFLENIEHDGKKYDAVLESLKIRLDEKEIVFEAQTSVNIGPGIDAICNTTARYHVGMLINKGGAKSLGYTEAVPTIQHNWTRKDKGAVFNEILLGILSAVEGLIGAALMFVPGAQAIGAGLLIASVLTGGVLLTLKIIEAVGANDAPPIDLLVTNATQAITWANGTGFELTSAELNNSLQLGGVFTGAGKKL